MLRIHHSNRLEVLLDRLVRVLDGPLSDPFAPERIVVQNQGMARWLAHGLAERTGIAANLEFPLPARLLWELLGCWVPDLPAESQWERGRLLWRIFPLLGGCADDPVFAEPARYLKGPGGGADGSGGEAEGDSAVRTYQLACRVADLFDQYLVYRPDLVLGWEQGAPVDSGGTGGRGPDLGPSQPWQSALWRRLAADIQSPHRAALFQRLELALAAGQAPLKPLPERVLLFGLSALPPIDCRVLAGVAELIPVELFVLNPSREYWADLVDEGRKARTRARDLLAGAPDTSKLLDLGNPLLASWGHGGMAFQDQLVEMGGDPQDGGFEEPDQGTLLGLIQGDLLDLNDRRTPEPAERTLLDPADRSIEVHACHGPHREVQVLHDRLLQCFESLAGLRPRDIVAMAPDIDLYAPHIEAVFGGAGAGEGGARRIPWSVADRRLAAEEPLLAALAALLRLPGSRLGAAEVLDWLAVPAIARRFGPGRGAQAGLDAEALGRIRTWVAETGIRWGLDGAMRRGLDLPENDANTWAFGLRRLFLGYALPPGDSLYRGVLPYPDLEGQEAQALGGLQQFIDRLGYWRLALARPRPLAEWATAVNRLIADLTDPDEDESDLLQPLRESLDRLAADAAAAGFEAPVGLPILDSEVAACLDSAAPVQRFLTGRVTFCNMVPMRSIPARVLCLLGMNGADFPRDRRPLGFDLMAAAPRRGDRSRREDDRHLFLESLLSARERLHISFVGQDQRDNAPKVPCVMVSELLDYVQAAFRFADGAQPAERLLVRHPLQPFSGRYFDGSDPRLTSYREDWCSAARAGREPGADRFAPVPLGDRPPESGASGDREPEVETLELADLIRFLRLPAQWFLTRTLGLAAPDRSDTLEEVEPFVLDGLAGWGLRQRIFGLAQHGRDNSQTRAVLHATGLLPHGAVSGLILDDACARVAAFRAGLARYLSDPRPPLELELELDLTLALGPEPGSSLGTTGRQVRLVGWLEGLTGCGLVEHRLGGRKARDLLGLWVRHLALNRLAPAGIEPRGLLVCERKNAHTGGVELETLSLAPVPDALERLCELVGLFFRGRREPLPLFPETSLAFADQGWDRAARSAWEGGFNGPPGECDGWAVRTAFRGRDPLDCDFESLAVRICGPLLAALRQDAVRSMLPA
jgi:exodeoxyribonuclease V gamma subunit